jgi:hypothetical protein
MVTIFCFKRSCILFCRHFNTGKKEIIFTDYGYHNWKKALEKNSGIIKHEKYKSHLYSMFKYENFIFNETNKTSIANIMDNSRLKTIENNRRYVKTVSKVILNLAISESSFRGHQENIDNTYAVKFLLCVKTIAEYDNVVKESGCGPNNAGYISSDIQNEIIDIFKYAIYEVIINEVKEPQYYLIINDNTRDINKTEMMSIAIRCVHKNTVKESWDSYIRNNWVQRTNAKI